MKPRSLRVSFCIGIYNEESILKKNIQKIQRGLNKIVGKNNYEIIIVDNGSTDTSPQLLRKLVSPKIKTAFIQEKGLGRAYKKAIFMAKYPYIVLSAIDLPFGFDDLSTAMRYWDDYDIIFGSKAHHKSHIIIPLKRKLLSTLYRFFLKFLFHIPVRDTQGTIFLKKKKILPFLTKCDSETAFFTAQLALYSTLYKLKTKEIPVSMTKEKNRPSKIRIIQDGLIMFAELIKEFIKYWPSRKTF